MEPTTEQLGDSIRKAAKEGVGWRVAELLEKGVHVDAKDRDGVTPLMLSSYHGHKEIVVMLLEKQADVNAINDIGFSALTRASRQGHLEIVKLLVAKGGNIHHRAAAGHNALMYAALSDRLSTCVFLLSIGSDLFATNDSNENALTLYGFGATPSLSAETKTLRCNALQASWEEGPHPSQDLRRRNERWARRGAFLTVLAEHAYRPLRERALAIALAAAQIDPNEPIVIETSRTQEVFRDEGLVRYIVAFL